MNINHIKLNKDEFDPKDYESYKKMDDAYVEEEGTENEYIVFYTVPKQSFSSVKTFDSYAVQDKDSDLACKCLAETEEHLTDIDSIKELGISEEEIGHIEETVDLSCENILLIKGW